MYQKEKKYKDKVTKLKSTESTPKTVDWQALYKRYESKENWEKLARRYDQGRSDAPWRLKGSPRIKNGLFMLMPIGPLEAN